MIMPWCSSVVWNEVMVVSWPPCWLAVLEKTLPTLPTRAPAQQSPPVWSRKLRICAAMLPKRVGVPKMMASYCSSSSGVASGAACSSLNPAALHTSGGASSGTRFTTTSVPGTFAAPSAWAYAMASMCP